MKKIRLDQLVFDLGFTESRERAKTTIMSGHVFVNGQRVDKPDTMPLLDIGTYSFVPSVCLTM